MYRQVPQMTPLINARGTLSSAEAMTSLFAVKKMTNHTRNPSSSPSTTPLREKTWGLGCAGFHATNCPVLDGVGVEADGSSPATTCPISGAVAPARAGSQVRRCQVLVN